MKVYHACSGPAPYFTAPQLHDRARDFFNMIFKKLINDKGVEVKLLAGYW
jgi:hypothetical protein